jgi:hypothetical protein
MDRLEIDRAVLVLAAALPPGTHERTVADAVQRDPDRFSGLCRVDPWQGDAALAEMRKGFEELGACGLYLDPWEETFQANDRVVVPLLEEARRYRKPVVLNAGHVRMSHPTQIRDLASRFPDVQFVACNGGQINICGMLLFETRQMLEACPNVVIETAGTYREDYLEEIAAEVERAGCSCEPVPIYDQEFEMARVACPSQQPQKVVWGLNAPEVSRKEGERRKRNTKPVSVVKLKTRIGECNEKLICTCHSRSSCDFACRLCGPLIATPVERRGRMVRRGGR